MYIHGYTCYIHDGYTRISMYIVYTTYIHPVGYTWYIHGYPSISHGYRSERHIHGIYMEYSMYILEIRGPDVQDDDIIDPG